MDQGTFATWVTGLLSPFVGTLLGYLAGERLSSKAEASQREHERQADRASAMEALKVIRDALRADSGALQMIVEHYETETLPHFDPWTNEVCWDVVRDRLIRGLDDFRFVTQLAIHFSRLSYFSSLRDFHVRAQAGFSVVSETPQARENLAALKKNLKAAYVILARDSDQLRSEIEKRLSDA